MDVHRDHESKNPMSSGEHMKEQISLPSKLKYLPYIPAHERVKFMKAETFIMDFDDFQHNKEDIRDTYLDMVELKINRLPYDRQLIMTRRVENGEDKYLPIYAFSVPDCLPGAFIFLGNAKALGPVYDEKVEMEIRGIGTSIMASLIVMLATKGIVHLDIGNKRTRLGIGKESKTLGTGKYTMLRPSRALYGSEDGMGSPKRPHFRRGHIRNQRCGEGNNDTKKVWIEPVFVNGATESDREAYVG